MPIKVQPRGLTPEQAKILTQTTKKESFLRMGLMGEPGSGKTTSIVGAYNTKTQQREGGFPDVRVINFDDKLPPGVDVYDFANPEWVLKNFPNEDHSRGINVKDAFLSFCRSSIQHIPKGGTLLLSSWTSMSRQFDVDADHFAENYNDKDGTWQAMKFYGEKLTYGSEVILCLKRYQGHVIFEFHEQVVRTKQGIEIPGKFKPLASGQMADQLASCVTMFVRQIIAPSKNPLEPLYLWQILSDENFTAILPPEFRRDLLPVKNGEVSPYMVASYTKLCKYLPYLSGCGQPETSNPLAA